MVIYVWPDGYWLYEWAVEDNASLTRLATPHKKIDLDKHLDYDLTVDEINACIEALDE